MSSYLEFVTYVRPTFGSVNRTTEYTPERLPGDYFDIATEKERKELNLNTRARELENKTLVRAPLLRMALKPQASSRTLR